MSIIRTVLGGGSTGNVQRVIAPPGAPGLAPSRSAGIMALGGPVLDPVVGSLGGYEGWHPLQEPTLLAYLDGDEFTATTHGTSVATWTDKKAGNSAQGPGGQQPTVDVTTGLNGDAVVDFSGGGTGQLMLLPDIMSGLSAGSVFFIAKDNNDPPPVYDGHPFSCETPLLGNHYPYSDGTVYCGFGSTTRQTTVNPSTSLATWHIGNFNSAANDWSFFVNGVSQYSTTTNTVGFSASPSLAAKTGSTQGTWDGKLAILLLFSAVPNQALREKIEGWLAWRRGIASVLATAHPYRNGAPGSDTASFAGGPAVEGRFGRENLLTASEDFSDAVWGVLSARGVTTTNATTAPDSATTADKLANNSGTTNLWAQTANGLTVGAAYTFSVYLKAAERSSNIQVAADAFGPGIAANATFNLSAGTVSSVATGSAAIVDAGGGWWRCIVSGATQTSDASTPFVRDLTNGDGSSGFYAWGAQLNHGGLADAYLATTTAAASQGPLETGADTASVAGTVVGDPTGTLAATESGSDTASITGTVLVSGTLAATESGADTASITGGPTVAGTLAATEAGSDSASITGTVLVAGTLAATEAGADTASIAGGPTVSGSLSATEAGADAASVAGAVAVAGSLSATEGAGQDTATATGDVLVSGSLSATESGQDTASVTGSVLVEGSLSATETGSDTAAITGTGPTDPTGTLAATEAGTDTAAIAASTEVTGALAATESGSDTAAIAEALPELEPERRGGPALAYYGRHDKIRDYLARRRKRRDRKRTLGELLEGLDMEASHGTAGGVNPRTQASQDPNKDPTQEASHGTAGLKPRTLVVSPAAAAAAVAPILQSGFRKARLAEAERVATEILAEDTKRRRRRAATMLLLAA
jgi:hypothetical protein